MAIAVSLIIAVLMGLGGHQLRPTLRRDFEGGWFPVACYVVGLVLMAPFVVVLFVALGGPRKEVGRVVAAYFLAALGVGAGVVGGHYVQSDAERF